MDKNEMNELIKCSQELFQEMSLDGIKHTTISKANYLIETICCSSDYELYFNPFVVGMINLLEYLNHNNILLRASIDTYKLNSIKLLIENFDKESDKKKEIEAGTECTKETQNFTSNDLEVEYIKDTSALRDNMFYIDADGKYTIIDTEKNPLPPKGMMTKIRIPSGKREGIEFTIDSDGHLIYESEYGTELVLGDIDFDEIYSFSMDDALEYSDIEFDYSKAEKMSLETDKNNATNDIEDKINEEEL